MPGPRAGKVAPEDLREGLLETAGSAYAKAFEMDPDNKTVANRYAKYLQFIGEHEKAQSLYKDNKGELWRFYLRNGQYDKAHDILQELYTSDPKELSIVKGLLLIAEKTRDTEGLKKYSQEMLAIDNTPDNELVQIQMYLDAGQRGRMLCVRSTGGVPMPGRAETAGELLSRNTHDGTVDVKCGAKELLLLNTYILLG